MAQLGEQRRLRPAALSWEAMTRRQPVARGPMVEGSRNGALGLVDEAEASPGLMVGLTHPTGWTVRKS